MWAEEWDKVVILLFASISFLINGLMVEERGLGVSVGGTRIGILLYADDIAEDLRMLIELIAVTELLAKKYTENWMVRMI
ncbi:unnamed protein product [Blepharisma stoltei]|uniref:Uncharacterized protein n=1 Tax=Blepharisma stoltei TaxID=1481888 RepID=A0AAU9J3U9_9CILI|nr:unnamed protein product [Blepharisma stoltei]